MKRYSWEIYLGLSLVALSSALYLIHYAIFKDVHTTLFYTLMDIAFLPVEVLLVTMILHRLLNEREKSAKLEKLNMVVETFFSEMGTRVLTCFSDVDPQLDKIRKDLLVTDKWSDGDFFNVSGRLRNYNYTVNIKQVDLSHLQTYLAEKRSFMLRLLENPALLEHESFTDLLRAIFHLTEELAIRTDIQHLPDTDLQHISGDIKRVYGLLVHQWLDYMKYLKVNYPYLFSLAVRTNPFDLSASPVVR
ncbi:MAG: hypothetical protein HY808_04090 [Nitrospirae bacterium]|nr:hypothetical protein [Nitrospirota bacterium]